MSDDPRYLYPSLPEDRSLSARIRRAFARRIRRARGNLPPLVRTAREIHRATGVGTLAAAADLLSAWRSGLPPRFYVANLMWSVPPARRADFLSGASMDPFFDATIDEDDRLLIRDKVAFADCARRQGMPWLATLAVVNRNEGPPVDGAEIIGDKSRFVEALARLSASRDVFLKPSCGKQGRGVYRCAAGGNVRGGDGETVALSEMVERVFAYRHPDGDFGYVVQDALDAHPDMIELTGISVLTTARVVTAVRDGDVRILQFLVKIPAPGRITDNVHGGVTGTMVAGVDPESGKLRDMVGILRPENRIVRERTAVHPVTGRHIGGRELPQWKELLDLARRAALHHPRTATIGWDIGLARSGWVFLDVNARWGPTGSQVCTGEGLRPALRKIFPEHWPG